MHKRLHNKEKLLHNLRARGLGFRAIPGSPQFPELFSIDLIGTKSLWWLAEPRVRRARVWCKYNRSREKKELFSLLAIVVLFCWWRACVLRRPPPRGHRRNPPNATHFDCTPGRSALQSIIICLPFWWHPVSDMSRRDQFFMHFKSQIILLRVRKQGQYYI